MNAPLVALLASVVALCLIAVVVLLTAVSGTAEQDGRIDSYRQHCAEAGGHIYKPDQTSWCVSADGRFIEVYP